MQQVAQDVITSVDEHQAKRLLRFLHGWFRKQPSPIQESLDKAVLLFKHFCIDGHSPPIFAQTIRMVSYS